MWKRIKIIEYSSFKLVLVLVNIHTRERYWIIIIYFLESPALFWIVVSIKGFTQQHLKLFIVVNASWLLPYQLLFNLHLERFFNGTTERNQQSYICELHDYVLNIIISIFPAFAIEFVTIIDFREYFCTLKYYYDNNGDEIVSNFSDGLIHLLNIFVSLHRLVHLDELNVKDLQIMIDKHVWCSHRD